MMMSRASSFLNHQGRGGAAAAAIGEKPTASIEVQSLGEVDDLVVASNENFCHEGMVIDVVVDVVVVVVVIVVVVVVVVMIVIYVIVMNILSFCSGR